MGKLIDSPAAVRARELAKTGCFASLLELRLQLRREGYAATDLRGDKVRKELMDIIDREKIPAVNPSFEPSTVSQASARSGVAGISSNRAQKRAPRNKPVVLEPVAAKGQSPLWRLKNSRAVS